ncbi:hypothetical protein TNCV_4400641 [Trichonephila clavipes]|nr:hypothetical protein TNCV_4400641 [Trichonephila clavipes]
MFKTARPEKENARFQIKGLQDSKIAMTRGCVEIDWLYLRYHDPKVKLPVKAYVLEKLTRSVTNGKINETHFSHLKMPPLSGSERSYPFETTSI